MKKTICILSAATVFISFFILNLTSQAANKGYFYDQDGVISKGTKILITEYDPRLGGVFEVQTEVDYGSMAYYTRIGDLVKASTAIKNGGYRKKPRSLKGKQITLTGGLVVYTYPVDVD